MDRDVLKEKFLTAFTAGSIIKIVFQKEEYYSHSSITQEDVSLGMSLDFIQKKLLLFGQTLWQPSKALFETETKLGVKVDYPGSFDLFWNSYHKNRRVNKREAFNKWSDLSPEDKDILPSAAKKYSDTIEVESGYKFMLHPHRFISTGIFRDYAEMENNADEIIKASRFFASSFNKRFGFDYPFSPADKEMISVDVPILKFKRFCELVWIFFNDTDSIVKSKIGDNGYRYATFHRLLQGPLGYTKSKVPEKCAYCGRRGKHDPKCPLLHKAAAVKLEMQAEVAEAQDMNVDISEMFKQKIRK